MIRLDFTPKTMPCTQDCAGRTATCKFDGTCVKWLAYQLTLKKKPFKDEYYHEHTDKRNLVKGLSGGRH